MKYRQNISRGFTLIAALLVLVLLSGVAIGLLFMVGNEARMGGNDLEANQAYYGAESGMEKLTSDLSSLYTQFQSPNNAQIQNLINFPPTSAMVSNMTYTESIVYPVNGSGNPASSFNTISSGSNQGLYAEITPITLTVIATRPSGASVNITRGIEVAQIPVFQFGVFCGYDCSYFPYPNFSVGGRVHSNGNLFLAASSDLVFGDKVQAYGQIVTDRMENGVAATSGNGLGGNIWVPKANSGCPLGTFPPSGANCIQFPAAGTVPGDGSWSGGYPPLAGAVNANFPSLSTGTFNSYLANSLTGVTNMQLPFVQNSCVSNPPPCTDPIQIIRKPQPGESPTSAIGTSREYNKAQIRILLADTQAGLHPERGAINDGQDVQFPMTPAWSSPGNAPFQNGAVTLTAGGTEYAGFATVSATPATSPYWVSPRINSGPVNWATGTQFPLIGELTDQPTTPGAMTGPWIRVEVCTSATTCTGVTQEWLKLGFSRLNNAVPTTPGSNTVDPNAILILQQLRPSVAQTQASGHGAGTQGNFYPINFYDTREGEMRDNANGCAVNGIMNAVELDVGNLARWLNGTTAGTGTSVNYATANGYILYFSDHRGMLVDPNPTNGGAIAGGIITGESGLEDTVNSAQGIASTTPDGVIEPRSYYSYSPEDVDLNGVLDNWGTVNIGYGFGVNSSNKNPYQTTSCTTTGMANPVSGARHALKLVDGGMSAGGVSYLPVLPPAAACVTTATTDCGGFTIASENPVYVQGNYNSGPADPFWGGGSINTPHSAASIIADAVLVLSNAWTDTNSLNNPTTLNSRMAATTYYRMAVAAGTNPAFPNPGWAAGASQTYFGNDGGLLDFLRFLENWSGPGGVANPSYTIYYNGSLIYPYFSEYATGSYKCCAVVYSPPKRQFYFDTMFLNPVNLPPGTPMFSDIDTLSSHQNFTPQ